MKKQLWLDLVNPIKSNHWYIAEMQIMTVKIQYSNYDITSKKIFMPKLIMVYFYRRNAETVINSQRSIIFGIY